MPARGYAHGRHGVERDRAPWFADRGLPLPSVIPIQTTTPVWFAVDGRSARTHAVERARRGAAASFRVYTRARPVRTTGPPRRGYAKQPHRARPSTAAGLCLSPWGLGSANCSPCGRQIPIGAWVRIKVLGRCRQRGHDEQEIKPRQE